MPDVDSLASRIDTAFSAVEEKTRQFQAEQAEEYRQRQARLEQLGKVFEQMRDVWRPRLELLARKFGDRVKVTPRIVPSTREATFDFDSSLAHVRLRLSASTDRDVRKVVLGYHLEIIPILMRFTPHAEIEFDLNAVDPEAVGKWLDDRIVDFVQTYLALGENAGYLRECTVEDPVAHVRFPSMAAGATLEWQGQKFYFVGDDTRREFARQNNISLN